MAINELDAAYEDAFGTKALDPDMQAINDQKREDVTRLKVSASNAVDMQPDRKAEAMKIADKMKLPTAFVESNFEAFSREHQSTAVDFDRMVNEAPELAQWLGHPDNSVIAKDDIDNLRNLSDSVKEFGVLESVYQGLKSGVATAAASTARIPSATVNTLALPQNIMAGKINDLNRGYADKQQSSIAIDMNATDINITGKPAVLGQPKPIPTAAPSWDGTLASPEWLRNNAPARFFDFAAEEEAKNLPELSQSVVEKIGSGDWKAAGRAAAVQLATNAPQMAQTIALAMMGMPTAAAGMGGLQQMASSQQDSIDKGLPIVNATANSIAQGGAEFLGERLITVPGISKWSASIEKSFGKDTARKVIWDAAKTLGASFAQEGAEEAATQIAQDSSDYYFGANPDLTLKQGFENMLNAGIIGGLMGGSTTMTMVANQAARRAGEIRGAERTKELLTAIKEGALTSKLRARMPEAHAKAIDTIAKDGPVESILMPADAVQSYFQGKGLDASAEAQKLGFGKEFSEAMEIGGDVKVSLGQFISKVSESEHFQGLVDNSKFQPEGLTPNEAKTEQDSTKAQLKMLSKQTDEVDTKPEIELTPEERVAKSARAVKADMKAQLLEMNDPLMGPKEAEQNATLFAQGILSLATSAGRDPMEFYNERRPKVRMRESLAEARGMQEFVDSTPESPGAVADPEATSEPTPSVLEIQRNESGAIVYDVGNLAALRRVISDSAIEQGAVKRDDEGYAQGMIGSTSTFPEFFKNKGYKKADVLRAIDKAQAGETLTEKQQAIVDDLYEGYIDSINRGEMFQNDRELFQSDAALAVQQVYAAPASPTFSKLIQIVETKMGGSADPQQIRAMLKDVKEEEKKWLGLEEFLAGKEKIKKQDLLDFLKANEPEIVDVTLGGRIRFADFMNQRHPGWREFSNKKIDEIRDSEFKQYSSDSGTKYSQYTLPGGENYREVLFTLPPNIDAKEEAAKKKEFEARYRKADDLVNEATKRVIQEGGDWTQARQIALEKGYITQDDLDTLSENQRLKQTQVQRANEAARADYTSSHFDEKNILAHVRLDDRVDADGKKVLFVEEIQSDWHQAGRKKGYKGDVVPTMRNFSDFMAEKYPDVAASEVSAQFKAQESEAFQTWRAEQDAAMDATRAVPDAPFKKTWHEYAMKRIIRMAAEGGYERIAWTRGEQQAERFDLSKQIQQINHKKAKGAAGGYTIEVYEKNGRILGGTKYNVQESELSDLVGKEMAEKIVKDEGASGTGSDNGFKVLSGLDLKVGGEGMKGFYDKILVDYANKLGKKFGAKVGETSLDIKNGSRVDSDGDLEVVDGGQTKVHSLDVTDKMKEVALGQGFELFQGAPIYGILDPQKLKERKITKAFVHSLAFEKMTMDQARQSVLGNKESIEVNMPAGARLLITRDTFGKSTFEGRVRGISEDEKLASAIIAKNIETLIPDLVFNEVEPNKKPFAKPWAKDYRRFYGVVEIDGSEYAFHFKTERPVRGKAAKYDIERVYFEFARKLETPDRPAEAGSFEGSKTNQTVRPLKNFPGKAEITIDQFAEKVNSVRESDPLFQGNEAEDSPNGRIVIRPNKQMEIDLFRGKANLSTFLHETGHFYLEIMDDLAKDPRVSQRLKNDYATIREWLGAKPGEKLTVDQHEQWARGFELYLARGNAPTKELRGAFASFKVWLSAIYKNLNRLNVELTPEITGVMDRLLATDEQLAEAVRGQPSLFDNPLTQGMSEAQAAKYKQLEDDEKRAMNEELTAKAVAHEMKKREAAYKEARKEVQAKVELEANAMTNFNLLAALQRGTMADGSELPDGMKGIKLDRQSILEVYGKEFLESLPRPFIYAKEGGLHFDLAAEMFGFTSGDAMLKSLVGMPTKKEFIERETNRQMDIRFPDKVMQQFPEEAVKAAHADPHRKRLYFELETLARDNLPMLKDAIKRVARRVPREADVKAQAVRLISAKKLADIKPYVFERAERKAAKEAGVLLAKGDISGAFEAKRRELLNYELFKAATDAVESMEKAQEFFKKFRQSDEDLAKTRDTDLVNVGRAILAQHGIGKADKTAAQYLENMKKYDQESYDSAVAIIMNADLTPAPFKEISFDHFTNLHDTVKSIWDLSKQARSIEIDGKRMDREEIKIDLMSAIGAISDGPAQKEYNSTMTDDEKTGLSMLSMRASLTRMEHWATASDRGNRQGAFTRYFINPIRDAITNYRIAKKSYMAEAKAILDPIAATLGAPRVIVSDELGFKFKSKAELLGAILHTGNESNIHKLLIGYGWAEKLEDGTVDTTKWDRFVTRMWAEGVLTKADYDAVQGIWDLMEKLKPDTQKAHKAMYGFYFNEITSKEIVTPWGNYKGGYVPAKTDPYTVDAAARRADENALESRDNTFAFPTTGRGATKSRVENYTAPLQLDVRLTLQHIDWALRFTYLEPRVKELGRLATDPEFRQSMKAVDPEIVSGMIVPWLQRVARQNVMTSSASKSGRWWDQKLSLLRSRSSLQMMAFNLVNALQNYTALFPTMLRVRGGLMMANFWTYAKGPKEFAEMVASKSPYMSTRLGDQARDIQHEIEQILENPSPYVSGREWLVKHSQILQAATQNSIDTVVWHSAYTQELEKGVSDKEAVRAADAVVREALGSMAPEDVSSFESGSALLRALSMFYGFFNNQANLLKTEFDIHKELGLQKRAGRAFYAYTLVVMAPAIVGALLSRALGGKFDDDDDGEQIDDLLDVLFMSQFKYMTAMVPGGGVLNSIINRFNDKAFDDKISVSPIIGTLEKVGSAPISIAKAVSGSGKSSAAIKDSLTAIGFITGTPGGALARPLGYLADVAEGEARPSGPIDFSRGLVTGKPGPKQ